MQLWNSSLLLYHLSRKYQRSLEILFWKSLFLSPFNFLRTHLRIQIFLLTVRNDKEENWQSKLFQLLNKSGDERKEIEVSTQDCNVQINHVREISDYEPSDDNILGQLFSNSKIDKWTSISEDKKEIWFLIQMVVQQKVLFWGLLGFGPRPHAC